ncbi:GNAT family N-acetyltransferase [bacterium]|nr:GNAT family N-acetyltransferase [bacterium]
MSFRIRPARREDTPALYELDKLCFTQAFRFSRAMFRHLATREDIVTFIAEDDESPAHDGLPDGFVMVEILDDGASWVVTSIDVHPRCQRRGLGELLMTHADAFAKSRGLFKSYLQVYVRNSDAIRFYRRLGYEIVDILPAFYGAGRNGFLMLRDQTPATAQPAKAALVKDRVW